MKSYLSLIKFSHTVFALPFALIGFTLGYIKTENADFLKLLVLVLLCMVFARSAAMAFNRWLDKDIDAQNPRTTIREIPAGIIAPKAALWFVIANVLLFIVTTYFINPLCFALSPIALIVILGYSYTKRFTAYCHLVLGLGLSLAPVGAYLAVTGVFDLLPILLGVAVLFWVAGFDIIYALQDQEFDKSQSLNSIPVATGTKKAIRISEIFHIVTAAIICITVYMLTREYMHIGWLSILAVFIFVALLFYQHHIVKEDDLSKINLAFFTTNGIASIIFGSLLIVDLLI